MDTKELLNQIKKPIFEKYPNLPLNWVCDEDELVHKIVNEWPAEKCVYLLRCTSEALEILQGKNPIFNDNPDVTLDFKKNVDETIVWDWRHLLDIAENKNWEQLQNDSKHYSSSMFVLGYVLIYLLTTAKIYLYLKDHRHNIDLLYIKFADILEQDKDPFIANFPKKSLDRIINFIDNIYKEDTSMSLYDLDKKYLHEVNYQIGNAIHDAFPSELEESIDKAIKGDIKIDFIPNYVSKKIITEFTKNNPKDILTWSIDENIIIEESKETFKDRLKDDFDAEEFINIIENQELMDVLTDFITDNPNYLTLRQRQVLLLHSEGNSLQEIGDELEIRKQTVDESLKSALKKLRKIIDSITK